jgi:hypothetical protein
MRNPMANCWTLLVSTLLLVAAPARAADSLERPTPQAHGAMRAGIESGYQQGEGAFVGASYRYAIHDLLDPAPDYPKDTELELLNLAIRVPLQSPRFWLDDFTAVRVASIPPMETLTSERSWELELGARTDRDTLCDHCIAGHLRAGLGGTWRPIAVLPFDAFLLVDADVSYGPGYSGFPVKPGFGPHAGIRLRVTPALALLTEGHYRYTISAPSPNIYDYGVRLRWSPAFDTALDVRFQRYLDGWESAGGLMLYF